METVTLGDFERLHVTVGRVVDARVFEEARRPAYVLRIDFGDALGVKKSSARITARYTPGELVGRLVVALVNVPSLQVGPLRSECRVLGFDDGAGGIALCVPDREVPLGARLH